MLRKWVKVGWYFKNRPDERRRRGVKKWINMVSALFVLAAFSLGCAGMVSTDQQVKCPKCGADFTINEGAKGQVTR